MGQHTRSIGHPPRAEFATISECVPRNAHQISRKGARFTLRLGRYGMAVELYYSYNQFLVYDESVPLPGCAWTEKHSAQGFARRESTVNFSTLLEFGYAQVSASREPYLVQERYERVIAVPFLITSGKVRIEGPEETQIDRMFALAPGNYRLVAAQWVIGADKEGIDLFFESLAEPLERSALLVADHGLNPLGPLVETAKVAGED